MRVCLFIMSIPVVLLAQSCSEKSFLPSYSSSEWIVETYIENSDSVLSASNTDVDDMREQLGKNRFLLRFFGASLDDSVEILQNGILESEMHLKATDASSYAGGVVLSRNQEIDTIQCVLGGNKVLKFLTDSSNCVITIYQLERDKKIVVTYSNIIWGD